MNLTYAVPDLHGRYDLLEKALQAIALHPHGDDRGFRTVVFLGDYIDRGPQSREIIERLMAGPPDGWKWIYLKGNHEDMLIEAYNYRSQGPRRTWLYNGGDATLESFEGEVPRNYVDWMTDCALMRVDRHRVFVHAGVDPNVPLDEQDEEHLLWSREETTLGHGARHVVHGHTPDLDGPVLSEGRTNLDTLAWKTGRLVIGVFDDDRPGGPIELLEVRGPSHGDFDEQFSTAQSRA